VVIIMKDRSLLEKIDSLDSNQVFDGLFGIKKSSKRLRLQLLIEQS
jgi:hypothetical protein